MVRSRSQRLRLPRTAQELRDFVHSLQQDGRQAENSDFIHFPICSMIDMARQPTATRGELAQELRISQWYA